MTETLPTGDRAFLDAVQAARRLRRPRFEEELEAIAEAADVTLGELRGPARHRQIVAVRRLAAAYMHQHGASLPEIGRALRRDHTTVLYLLGRRGIRRRGGTA